MEALPDTLEITEKVPQLPDVHETGISLTELLDRESSKIRPIPAMWFYAEITYVQQLRDHLYLELVEHDPQGEHLVKCAAWIWGAPNLVLQQKFEAAAGYKLMPGITIRAYGAPGFRPQYGVSVGIEDIDPNHSVGAKQKKLEAIREQLGVEGILLANRTLVTPQDFYTIAVISPEKATDLAEFRSVVQVLKRHGLCRFAYYKAVFQGENASASLCRALSRVQAAQQQHQYDAVAIVRGPGSVPELAYLNDYEVARALCMLQIPVFTGIGSSHDTTILDEVCNLPFDTAVAMTEHMMDGIARNAQAAMHDFQRILGAWERARYNSYRHIDADFHSIHQQITRTNQKYRALSDNAIKTIASAAVRARKRYAREIRELFSESRNHAVMMVRAVRTTQRSFMQYVRHKAYGSLASLRRKMPRLRDEFVGHVRDMLLEARSDQRHLLLTVQRCVREDLASYRRKVPQLHTTFTGHVKDMLRESKLEQDKLMRDVREHTQYALTRYPPELLSMRYSVAGKALATSQLRQAQISAAMQAVAQQALGQAARAKRGIYREFTIIRDGAPLVLHHAREQVINHFQLTMGFGPRHTLERGFTLTRADGCVVSSLQEAQACCQLEIEFHDGRLTVSNPHPLKD
ncbi:MAG TPA: exodeoxyribonuclease VII large subunit [Methylophilaceae bacterium]|nr:exodeoxyribonuclease VII large subunit [Methylophilaceae bacterium]